MLGFLGLWFLVRVCGRLPARALNLLAVWLGTGAWYASRRLRALTRDHMRHALGVAATPAMRDEAARGCVRAASLYYADFARGPYLDASQLWQSVEAWEGADHFFAAVDSECGVILLSAHLGNPEFTSRAIAQLDLDLLILTEPLSPPRREAFVHGVRESNGRARYVPANLGGVRAAIEHLRGGGVLAVLGDRDVLHNGRPVTFFGERARLPWGPVELALRTGATLLPAFVLRAPGGRLRMVVDPPLRLDVSGDRERDIAAGMLQVAGALERGIARAPEQWFPLDPVWRGIGR